MSELMTELRRAKEAGDIGRLSASIPYARFLGVDLSATGNVVLATMRYSETLIGNPALPALHGGTLAALLESVAAFQVIWDSDTVVLPKIITITVDYLRSARPVDTFAAGVITRRGRRVANVRAEAWQEDRTRPVAAAHCHFLIKTD